VDMNQVVKLVVDGVWKKDSCIGVAAWCGQHLLHMPFEQGFTHVHALSSTGVEALAILPTMRWARAKGLRKLQIFVG